MRVGLGSKSLKVAACSPDAFAQLAISLAWCIAHEKAAALAGVPMASVPHSSKHPSAADTPWFVAQYEPAQARRFAGGRTACIRSSTPELLEAISACLQQWRKRDAGSATRAAVLARQAMYRHSMLSSEAAAGHDVDRHLFGMQLALREANRGGAAPAVDGEGQRGTRESKNDLGKLMGDDLVQRSSRWRISTSNLTLPGVSLWGWGEVVPDGIGVAYSVHGGELHFHLCSERSATIGSSMQGLAGLHDPGIDDAALRTPLAEAVANELRSAVEVLWRLLGKKSGA